VATCSETWAISRKHPPVANVIRHSRECGNPSPVASIRALCRLSAWLDRNPLVWQVKAYVGFTKVLKVRDVLKKLNDDGWYLHATRGSHRQFKHPSKVGRVTVPGKPGDDLAPGTANSIFKQAGWK